MKLVSASFLSHDDLCDYVKQRRINRPDIQSIVYETKQHLYVLFYWL